MATPANGSNLVDAASFFQQTVGATNINQFAQQNFLPNALGGGGANRRVPFTFTSTKRLQAAGLLSGLTDINLAMLQEQDRLNKELQAIQTGTFPIVLPGSLNSGLQSLALQSATAVITMLVNPNSIKWSQPKRFTKRDTMEGSTFFHFTNQAGQNYDILTLHFTGASGNINTQNGQDAGQAVNAFLKLRTWHNLYNLSREPMLLGDSLRNDFFITYKSVLMPIPITFVGFFNNCLEFTDDAANPFNKNYSFSFTVTNVTPSLDSLIDAVNTALTITQAATSNGPLVPFSTF